MRIVHEVLVFPIDEPMIELDEFVQHKWRYVKIFFWIDSHVEEDALDLAQHLVNSFGRILEEPRADVDLIGVEETCSFHRR